MLWDNVAKLFKRLTGGIEAIQTLSLAGGGTGANDAAGARVSINVNEAGTGGAQTRTNDQADAIYAPLTRQVATTSPLTGGGDLNGDLTLGVDFNNTLTSTATDEGLSAAQGKVLKGLVDDITDVGFYQEETLGTGGTLTGGSCKVVRVGSLVAMSGRYTHSSSTSRNSGSGFIPVWARPSGNIYNVYSKSIYKEVSVDAAGFLVFSYDTSPTDDTLGFTISYTV